ncbi:NADP-dependent oxidoreductase domain-containing protein [Mycena metata]|uniref:NADP-dependent oxidoreductase domain-containing protein n=1 Tax=Mycena metata TaxID=1033252 RepID=A0AAD7KCH7_9AGAR|nr:NADP-dependent oxidoreductase domain-containing protein [Mycena metata]
MSAAEIPSYKLNDWHIHSFGRNGVSLVINKPCGSLMSSPDRCYMNSSTFTEKQVYDMCQKAIKVGYRHFDTATGYGNEQQVGKAIRDSGIPRNEFYITYEIGLTVDRNGDHHRVREAFEESFNRLNTEYIDLYLLPLAASVHGSQINAPNMALTPEESPTFVETWKEIEKLLDTGKVKSIGVSNFSIKTLEELLAQCSVTPANNQVELHPCLPQDDLKTYCQAKGILLTAYSPLGRSKSFFAEQPLISALAEKYNTTAAQIILSWGVQRGTVVVPKSEDEGRMLANITLVKLSPEDMQEVGALHLKPGMHKSLVPFHSEDGGVFGWKYSWLGWNMTTGGIVPQ